MTAASILHARLGSPRFPGAAKTPPTACWICGGISTRNVERARFNGSQFVGQNRVRAWASPWVCEACACVMAWLTPPIMPVPGRTSKDDAKRAPTWRNYTVLVDDRGVLALTKGEKPAIRDWLRAPKVGAWFAAIADSGQKHVVPWAPVNPSVARVERVLFEERELAIGDWALLDAITHLLTVGASKETLATGQYTSHQYQLCGEAIDRFEMTHSRDRASAWWDLALWLAQRDEAAVAARMEDEKNARREAKASARRSHRTDGAGDSSGVPAKPSRKRTEALGSDPRPDAERGSTDGISGGVDHDAPKIASARESEPRQRSLF